MDAFSDAQSRNDLSVIESTGAVTVGIKSRRRALEESLYGVLFTLAKEKLARKSWFAIFLVIIDFLQLLAFAFVGGIPWVLPEVQFFDEILKYLSFVQLQNALADLGYIAYIIAVVALSVMQLFCLSVSILIAYYFRQNHFPVVWPIRVARLFIGLFLSSFYISSLQIFLVSMDCVFIQQEQAFLESYPSVLCWEFPNALVISVSAVMMVLFFGASFLIQLVQFDPSPRTAELLGSPEAKIEIRNFFMKTLLTIVTVVLSSYGLVQAVTLLIASSFFLYNGLVFFPMYSNKMNVFRNTLYATLWFAASMSVLLFIWNSEESLATREIMTYIMLGGLVPAGLLGGVLSYLRGRRISNYKECQKCVVYKKDLEALKENMISIGIREINKKVLLGAKAKGIHRLPEAEMMETPEDEIGLLIIFANPAHVERMTRFVRDDPMNPARIRLGTLIYLEGLRQFPESAFLHLAFCDYLEAYTQHHDEAQTYLDLARQKKPRFYDRFNIFVHDRQRLQEQHASASGTTSMDLVTYVDFKNKYHQALSIHRKTLKIQRMFWKLVLTKRITHVGISNYIKKIGVLEMKATDTYAQLLERYSNSAKVLRTYSRFLTEIKHDHLTAEKISIEADKLEEADAIARRQTFMDGLKVYKRLDTFGVYGDDADSVILTSFSMLREDRDPICVLKVDGKIEFVNDIMAKLLGYARRGELAGKNINVLLPSPVAGRMHEQMMGKMLSDEKKQSEVYGKAKGSYVKLKDGGLMPVVMALNNYQSTGAVRIFFTLKEDKTHSDGEGLIVLTREGHIAEIDKNILSFVEKSFDDVADVSIQNMIEPMSFRVLQDHLMKYHSSKLISPEKTPTFDNMLIQFIKENGDVITRTVVLRELSYSDNSLRHILAYVKKPLTRVGLLSFNAQGIVTDANIGALSILGLHLDGDPTNQPMLTAAGLRLDDVLSPSQRAHVDALLESYRNGSMRRKLHGRQMHTEVHVWQLWHKDGFAVPCFVRHWVGLGETGQIQHHIQFEPLLTSVHEFMSLTLRLGEQKSTVVDVQCDSLFAAGFLNVNAETCEGQEIKNLLGEQITQKMPLRQNSVLSPLNKVDSVKESDTVLSESQPANAAVAEETTLEARQQLRSREAATGSAVTDEMQEQNQRTYGARNTHEQSMGELSSEGSVDSFSRRTSREDYSNLFHHLVLPIRILNGRRMLSRVTVRPGPQPIIRILPIEGVEGTLTLAEDETVISWSAEAEMMTNLSPNSVIGSSISKIFPFQEASSHLKKDKMVVSVEECVRLLAVHKTDVALDRQKAFSLSVAQAVSFSGQLAKCLFHITLCDDNYLRHETSEDEQGSVVYRIVFSCLHGGRSEMTRTSTNLKKAIRQWKLAPGFRLREETDTLDRMSSNSLPRLSAIEEAEDEVLSSIREEQSEEETVMIDVKTRGQHPQTKEDASLFESTKSKNSAANGDLFLEASRRSMVSNRAFELQEHQAGNFEGDNTAPSEDSQSVSFSAGSSKQGLAAQRLSRMKKVSRMLHKYSIRESVRRFKSFILFALVGLVVISATGLIVTELGLRYYLQSIEKMQDIETIIQDCIAISALGLGIQRRQDINSSYDVIWSSEGWVYDNPPMADVDNEAILKEIEERGGAIADKIIAFSKFSQNALGSNSSLLRSLYEESSEIISILDRKTGLRGVQEMTVIQIILNFASASLSLGRQDLSSARYAESKDWFFIEDNWHTMADQVGQVLGSADSLLKLTLTYLEYEEIGLIAMQLAVLGLIFFLLIRVAGKSLVQARMRLLNVFLRLPRSSIRVVIEDLSQSLDKHDSDVSDGDEETVSTKANDNKKALDDDDQRADFEEGATEAFEEREGSSQPALPATGRKSVGWALDQDKAAEYQVNREQLSQLEGSATVKAEEEELDSSGENAKSASRRLEKSTSAAASNGSKYGADGEAEVSVANTSPGVYDGNSEKEGRLAGSSVRSALKKESPEGISDKSLEGKLSPRSTGSRKMSIATAAISLNALDSLQARGKDRKDGSAKASKMGVSVYKYIIPLSFWGLLHVSSVAFNIYLIVQMSEETPTILKSSERISLCSEAMLHANHYFEFLQPRPPSGYDSVYGTVGQTMKAELPDYFQPPAIRAGDVYLFNGTDEAVKRFGQAVAALEAEEAVVDLALSMENIKQELQGLYPGSTLSDEVHDILYSRGTCHVIDEEKKYLCPNESSTLFPELTQGLDVILARYLNLLRVIVTDEEPLSAVNLARVYEAISVYYPHVKGALQRLNDRTFEELRSAQRIMEQLHVATFLTSVVGLLVFYLVTVRPFLANLEKEGTRSIDLLVALPERAHLEKILEAQPLLYQRMQGLKRGNKVSPTLQQE